MLAANPPRWPARSEPPRRRATTGAAASAAARVALPLSASSERARRRVVTLIFAIYLLAIFEGALRKWVLPQFSQYIFFIRDPILVVAYAIATQHRLWPRGQAFFTLSVGMCGAGVLMAALQAGTGAPSDLRLILGFYGWRSYFLYVPMAFLVGAVFRREDLLRLFKLTLFLAVPVGVLVAAQFAASPTAAINVGNAAEEELQFHGVGLNRERTRPMGPFASGAGQQQFTATACAIALAFFVAPKHIRKPSFLLLAAGTGGMLTAAALSGSRGTVLQCGLALVFALALGVLGRGGALKGRAVGWPLVLAVGAVTLYPLLFPEGFEAFTHRWVAADTIESGGTGGGVFVRAFVGMIDFFRLVGTVPFLGYGLGYGGNASITLGAVIDGVRPGLMVETDFARHMVDLGPLAGTAYIVFRLALAGWLTAMVLRVTRQSDDPMPMMLLSYVAYVVVMGQITGQGAINLYGWLFTGLLIAACREAGARRRPLQTSLPPAGVRNRTRR